MIKLDATISLRNKESLKRLMAIQDIRTSKVNVAEILEDAIHLFDDGSCLTRASFLITRFRLSFVLML